MNKEINKPVSGFDNNQSITKDKIAFQKKYMNKMQQNKKGGYN